MFGNLEKVLADLTTAARQLTVAVYTLLDAMRALQKALDDANRPADH